jgi:hypothetical protein
MAKSILPYVVLGASDALDNPNINLLFNTVSLKLRYPSPFILSVLNVPLPPQALLLLIVVRVLYLCYHFICASIYGHCFF